MEYLYLITFVAMALLMFGFYTKEFVLLAISGMMLMVVGVYVLSSGMLGVDNFLTGSFGIIVIGIGGYVLIRGGIETFKNFGGENNG